MLPFNNNLVKGDKVYETKSKRYGIISAQPRPQSVGAMAILEGLTAQRYFPIMDLRLVVNGEPEEFPPCDGVPPEWKQETTNGVAAQATPPPPPRGLAAAFKEQIPPPPPILPRGLAVSAKVDEESKPAPKADAAYEGDLTLERLLVLRSELVAKLAALDERLLMLRIQVMLKRTLEPIRAMAELENRCDIASDTVKLRAGIQEIINKLPPMEAGGRIDNRGI